jgi:hypothetical protein
VRLLLEARTAVVFPDVLAPLLEGTLPFFKAFRGLERPFEAAALT